jgi:uncharacterized membrane protein
MDWPYLHTLVNHFPIILTVVGTAVAVFAALTRRRGAWMYAVVSLTFAGLAAYPAFFSGDEAHEVMEKKWYVVKSMIDSHEESAEVALWLLLAAGVIAAYTWWRMQRRERDGLPPGWLRVLVLVSAFASLAGVSFTAWKGGKIVHESPRLLQSTGPGQPGPSVPDTTEPHRP